MHINTISYILQETTFKQSLCLGCLDTDKVERGNRKKKAFLSVTNFALNSPSLYAAIAEKRSKKKKKNKNQSSDNSLFFYSHYSL